ncbi:uncharacterized protein LOC128960974 [Oppia nitens]|uniref:uncharacterized protein LOC128960974 n=1 Tax=Oppia nitens TaxID=1686743 RepID=UPI0023DB6BD8|nr:uncharacterized protein LOC128960974 [Oppia nitens]
MDRLSGDNDSNNFVTKYCKYLNRKVILKTVKATHIGSLKCIDPLTQTVALVVTKQSANRSSAKPSKLILAMSHAITSIDLVDQTDDSDNDYMSLDLNDLLCGSVSTRDSGQYQLSVDQLIARKQSVMSWLHKNRIPCEASEDGSLCIAYALTLRAPYTSNECVCGNEMVLHQIQVMLDSMPTN